MRDRPVEISVSEEMGTTGTAEASSLENCDHLEQKGGGIVLEFGDLLCEENRVRFIEAMILDHVLPARDVDHGHIDAAIFKLPRSTMNDVVATSRKMSEAFCKLRTTLLKSFE